MSESCKTCPGGVDSATVRLLHRLHSNVSGHSLHDRAKALVAALRRFVELLQLLGILIFVYFIYYDVRAFACHFSTHVCSTVIAVLLFDTFKVFMYVSNWRTAGKIG